MKQAHLCFLGLIALFCCAIAPLANAQGSFTISASPTPVSISQGNGGTVTITITPVGTFNSTVNLALTGLTTGCGQSQFSSAAATAPYSPVTLSFTITAACAVATYPLNVVATSSVAGAAPPPTPISLIVLTTGGVSPATAESNLKNNFGFGVALGLGWNVLGPNIVTSATVDANGIVRVNTRSNTTAGFLLESHYFIWPRVTSEMVAGSTPDNRTWGTGPFVAAQPGSSQIISAVGAGWMFGFRRPKGSTPSGFGLGVGYEAIPAAQVLGSEFVSGQKAPVDPTTGQPLPIRYETEDKGSVLMVLSVSF